MLDHVTLRTHDLDGTRAFLEAVLGEAVLGEAVLGEAVLGLKPGYRPAFPFPGYWLYAQDTPVVHLIPGHGGPVDRDGETIDHVAFRLTDHDGMRRKLERLSIPYSRMDLPELGERRLFIRTPTGILLELVFREGSAASIPSAYQEQNHVE
jgi:catechol 2,3-dioxygenase-like lactoylglutathione lyase family enzyme